MSATANLDEATQRPRSLPGRADRSRLRTIAAWLNRVLLVIAGLVIIAAVLLGIYGVTSANTVLRNVTVAGQSLGGLTPAEAEQRLDATFAAYLATPLTLVSGDDTYELLPADLGVTLDTRQTVADAFAVGHAGSLWTRSLDLAHSLTGTRTVAPAVKLDGARLAAQLAPIAAQVERPATDASINMSATNEPILLADIPGVSFDHAANQTAIVNTLVSLGSEPINLVSKPWPPRVTAASLIPSLENARRSVAVPLTISAAEGAWHIDTDALKSIVAVDPATGALNVNQGSLTTLVESLAAAINRNAENAGIRVDENGRLAVVPSVEAATVDVGGSVAAITDAIVAGAPAVDLLVARAAPTITDAIAADAVAQGETLINTPLRLTWQDGSFELGRGELLQALTIHADPAAAAPFTFGLDPAVVTEILASVAAGYDQEAANARFRIIDDEIRLVSEAKTGRALDTEQGVADIVAAFGTDKHEIALRVTEQKPTVTASARGSIKLGDDILGEASTYYGESSEPRRQNVERGVELTTGWLVPPDGVFSFADALGGPPDQKLGFAVGFGIVANEGGGVTTAPVVGGGICQVSTTLFQAMYWAGLPIEERWQHPYYLRSYGEAPQGLPGLDAMVNIEPDWALDLKFKNTTGNWIAVILKADSENVVARIVGTDPGWDVKVDEPKITNIVRAGSEMTYTDSPELAAGKTLLVETAQDGFDVSVTRHVTDDGQVILEDTTSSSFAPSRNLTLRGTGTGQPAPAPSN